MKVNLRRAIKFFAISALFSATVACAETPLEHEISLTQKAIDLTSAACEIYPAIKTTDECVDKVVRKILADRDQSTEQVEQLIREQATTASAKHPQKFTDRLQPEEYLHQRALVYKLLDLIRTACTIPPAVTSFDECMDKSYHSILSSRDPHSGYMNAEEARDFRKQMSGELQGIGVSVVLTTDKAIGVFRVMEGSPAERVGIQDGDRIISVTNGTEKLSSPFAGLEEVLKKVKGKPGTPVTLDILRGESDQRLTLTVVRGDVAVPMVKTDILTDPNDASKKYAYVRLVHFGDNLRKKMVAAVKQTLKAHPDVKGIVFDVRSNPGGLVGEVIEAVDALVDSSEPFVSVRDNNGVRAYGTDLNERSPEAQPGDITKGLPMGVLIDGYSASAAEIFSGSLKKLERSVTIGKRTWSKGTMQLVASQGDGSAVRLTEGEYLIGSPANWIAVQCVGVSPDIEYEAASVIKPKKEMHECDLGGAIVSGGRSSDPNKIEVPLYDRDPVRYAVGLSMLEAVKALDSRESEKVERIKRLLKIKDKQDSDPEEK